MVSTAHYRINDLRIKITKPVSCPHCGYVTMIYDYRKRKTIDRLSGVTWYLVPRIICESCNRVTTVLPTFINPYKQYIRVINSSYYENKIREVYYGND